MDGIALCMECIHHVRDGLQRVLRIVVIFVNSGSPKVRGSPAHTAVTNQGESDPRAIRRDRGVDVPLGYRLLGLHPEGK